MKKLLLLSASLLSVNFIMAQCPVVTGAMINACGMGSPNTEGYNEFVTFTAAVTANASAYNLQYGSSPATTTANLSGMDAAVPTGGGSFTGCAFTPVTSSSASIPAGAQVIMIASTFDHVGYNLAPLCGGAPIYIIYVNPAGPNSNWALTGNFANSGGVRYIKVSSTAGGCSASALSYNTNGWPTSTDGNFVGWNAGGTATYNNGGCSAIALPVKFIEVSGKAFRGFNTISWKTGEEAGVQKFIVERSNDGVHFTATGVAIPKGSNSSYGFSDVNTGSDAAYYRIVSADADGSSTASDIIKIKQSATLPSFSSYPKPAADLLYFKWASAKNCIVEVIVTDAAGKRIMSRKVIAASGLNTSSINVSSLVSGIYYLQMITPSEKYTDTFIKK